MTANTFQRAMDSASPESALAFAIRRALAQVRTTTLAQVKAVTNSGSVSPIGTLTIQILVQQTDAAGNVVAAGTVFNVPYMRIAGGANAVIMDPQVGDIGIVGFGDRDLSKVIAAKNVAAPGSSRRHHWSDALWVATLPLGVTPTQYLQFNSDGITLVTPQQFKATADNAASNPPTLTMGSSGIVLSFGGHSITINGSGIAISGPQTNDSTITATGEIEGNGVKLSTHLTSGVTAGSSDSGPPVPG